MLDQAGQADVAVKEKYAYCRKAVEILSKSEEELTQIIPKGGASAAHRGSQVSLLQSSHQLIVCEACSGTYGRFLAANRKFHHCESLVWMLEWQLGINQPDQYGWGEPERAPCRQMAQHWSVGPSDLAALCVDSGTGLSVYVFLCRMLQF